MIGNQVKSFLGQDWEKVQQFIRCALDSEIELLNKVNSEVLSRAGKQLRPMVCLLMAKACSADGLLNEDSCRYAAASELLHNATLMHDDVADGSKIRRGAPSVSARIGANAAVLLGDFWLSKAVGEVLGAQYRAEVVQLFSKTLCDLSKGEMLQLQNAFEASTDEQDYLKVIYCKTASLFESACVSGALSVDASADAVAAAYSYANALGNAFQIKDDILDYQGGEKLGKPMGVDIREGKITLPLLGAFRNDPRQERKIRKALRQKETSPEFFDAVSSFVLANGGVEYASGVLDGFVRKAVSALDIFEDSQQKEYLVRIAEYNAFRNV